MTVCVGAAACTSTVVGSPTPGTVPGAPDLSVGDPSASGDPAASMGAGLAVEPYVVTGRVSKPDGTPLAGAEVWADNTLGYNSNALAMSGADGTYRIELPRSDSLTWRMGGHLAINYLGEQYSMDLEVDPTPFGSAEGAIRDFSWKLSGPRLDDPDRNYGGLVYVYESLESNGLPDGEIVIEFEPDGPLIDGSAGEPLTRAVDGNQIEDVPVGRYVVSAWVDPGDGGEAVPLLIRARDTGDYESAAAAQFRKDSVPLMELEVAPPW